MSDNDFIDPERFRLPNDWKPVQPPQRTAARKPPAKRMPRSDERYARTRLSWLLDRRNDKVCGPAMRLYLYLVIKTREGLQPVKLTNARAAEIGLDKFGKARALAHLAKAGHVSVVQMGNQAPVVTLVRAEG